MVTNDLFHISPIAANLWQQLQAKYQETTRVYAAMTVEAPEAGLYQLKHFPTPTEVLHYHTNQTIQAHEQVVDEKTRNHYRI